MILPSQISLELVVPHLVSTYADTLLGSSALYRSHLPCLHSFSYSTFVVGTAKEALREAKERLSLSSGEPAPMLHSAA